MQLPDSIVMSDANLAGRNMPTCHVELASTAYCCHLLLKLLLPLLLLLLCVSCHAPRDNYPAETPINVESYSYIGACGT
jgi:hypothetical protein